MPSRLVRIKLRRKMGELAFLDYIRRQNARYTQRYPDKVRAWKLAWKKRHAGQVRLSKCKRDARRILFLGRRIVMPIRPRMGVCRACGRRRKRTQIHHLQYVSTAPLAYTIELCVRCHLALHSRWKRKGEFPRDASATAH